MIQNMQEIKTRNKTSHDKGRSKKWVSAVLDKSSEYKIRVGKSNRVDSSVMAWLSSSSL